MIIKCKSCHSLFRLDSSAIKPTGSKVRCSNCRGIFKIYQPKVEERRKYQRVKTQNLISYFSFDQTGKLISHGLGIALDISKGGILLETTEPIKPGLIILTATDRKNNFFEVKGQLAYSKKISAETYFSGIKFSGVNERVTEFITNLIKEYNYQGHNLFIRWRNQEPLPILHESI
ncbi:MAG: zinc-ribbon domain-containing protein [Desulfobacterales bacterium]